MEAFKELLKWEARARHNNLQHKPSSGELKKNQIEESKNYVGLWH
jgi:hypothetical protein